MEKPDRVAIKLAGNGREYRLPVLRHYSVDVYCAETKQIDIFQVL